MGEIQFPRPVKYFCALTFSLERQREVQCVRNRLVDRLGSVDSRCGPLDFSAISTYYDHEMGNHLQKEYLLFDPPGDRGELATLKRWTNNLEREFAIDGKRVVNCDPGYVSRDKLVLASTKDFFHRIYLQEGIFAEVTLHYRRGRFRFFSWTYPDYRNEKVLVLLEKARAGLVFQERKNG